MYVTAPTIVATVDGVEEDLALVFDVYTSR
jgi:hypothetical protein